jgi:hypothetical protein
MTRGHLLQEISRLIETSSCSSIAILGSPGSGGTTFLEQLGSHLEGCSRNTFLFGPVQFKDFVSSFREAVVAWLNNEGLFSSQCDSAEYMSAASQSLFWGCLRSHLDLDHIKSLVIEIDDVNLGISDYHVLYNLFSELRKFCAEWRVDDLAVHFVTSGSWMPTKLADVFDHYQTSWPFVPDHNIFYLPNLTSDEVGEWLQGGREIGAIESVHSRYLWELTAGDTRTIAEVLRRLPSSTVSCEALYAAADTLVKSQPFAKSLRAQADQLSHQAQLCLGKMLEGLFVDGVSQPSLEEELSLSGFARAINQPWGRVVRFRNWVIESAVRYHWRFFRELFHASAFTNYEELIPPVICLNRDAYEFICEIENLLRNLVVMRLGTHQTDKHPLVGVYTDQKQKRENGELEDEFTRASKWRKRVQETPYVDTHAALISFSQTKHLMDLVGQLVYHYKDPVFVRLEPMMSDLGGFKDIRDAVEHNQVISEKSYDTLLRIRTRLYEALTISQLAEIQHA